MGTETLMIGLSVAVLVSYWFSHLGRVLRFPSVVFLLIAGLVLREVSDARDYLLGSYVFGFETAQATAEQLAKAGALFGAERAVVIQIQVQPAARQAVGQQFLGITARGWHTPPLEPGLGRLQY